MKPTTLAPGRPSFFNQNKHPQYLPISQGTHTSTSMSGRHQIDADGVVIRLRFVKREFSAVLRVGEARYLSGAMPMDYQYTAQHR